MTKNKKKMTLIDAINKLDTLEDLRSTLLRSGALSPTLFSYADIYRHYEHLYNEMKHKKVKNFRGEAVDKTSEKFGVCRALVYIAINKMKSQ